MVKKEVLGNIFINRNIDSYDDTIIMFLLSINTSSLKHLKDIFYKIFIWPEEYSASLNFQRIVKYREQIKKNSFSYLTFAEVLLMLVRMNKKDIINNAIRKCDLYIDKKFISNNAKREFSLYL